MQELLKKVEQEFSQLKEWFRAETSSLRTGRASPALVENLEVEYYGARTPLQHIASLSAPDAKTLVIQPWDKGALEAVGKAIERSSLNIAPIADGETIRLVLPPLTEERRRDILKVLHTKAEEARVRSRRVRDEAWKDIQTLEKEKKISEDGRYRAKEELQKRIDAFNKELEDLQKKKEKEILET